MYPVYLFLSKFRHLEYLFYVLKSEGCKWKISNHVTVFFYVKTINHSFLPICTTDQPAHFFQYCIHLSHFFSINHLNFCQISNMFWAFNHVEVECIFTLYHLFAFHSEVYSEFSPHVLSNTFPNGI